jgi:hypothetical protein
MSSTSSPLLSDCSEGVAINIVGMPLDLANGSVMVEFCFVNQVNLQS